MGDKPVFRVGAAGLDPRDWRLIEIVFRHSQYNRYEFRLSGVVDPDSIDILIANSTEAAGLEALACIRASEREIPVIAAVPRGAASSARHAISIERLTLQLLPILNRVVEIELLGQVPRLEPGPVVTSPVAAPQGTPPPGAGLRGGGETRSAVEAVHPERAAADASSLQAASSPAPLSPAPSSLPRAAPPGERLPAAAAPARSSFAEAGRSASASTSALAGSATLTSPGPVGRIAQESPEPARAAPVIPADGAASAARAASVDTGSAGRAGAAGKVGAPGTAAAAGQASNLVPFPRNGVGDAGITQRLRVLVVDDSPTVRRQLTLAFDRLGLECEPVGSAAEALARLDDGHYDLVLVDVVMPDMDGYRLTREIKRNRRLRGTPVIILTSRSSPFDLARGALAGCDTYLTKPVPFRALEAAVIRQLRRSLAIDDLTGLIRSTDAAPDASEPSRRGGMSQPLARVARLFGR